MDKKYTDVVIDDKVYTVGGEDDSAYMQELAEYINQKLGELRADSGFNKQPYGSRQAMILINFADDYCRMKRKEQELEDKYAAQEKDYYQLKREMVNLQLRMEQIQLQNQVLSAGVSGNSEDTKTLMSSVADSVRKNGSDRHGKA